MPCHYFTQGQTCVAEQRTWPVCGMRSEWVPGHPRRSLCWMPVMQRCWVLDQINIQILVGQSICVQQIIFANSMWSNCNDRANEGGCSPRRQWDPLTKQHIGWGSLPGLTSALTMGHTWASGRFPLWDVSKGHSFLAEVASCLSFPLRFSRIKTSIHKRRLQTSIAEHIQKSVSNYVYGIGE